MEVTIVGLSLDIAGVISRVEEHVEEGFQEREETAGVQQWLNSSSIPILPEANCVQVLNRGHHPLS
jgi:hypothetical protein